MGKRDGITRPWGTRTPYGPGEPWPVRVDSRLADGVAPGDKDTGLPELASSCHPQPLRQLKWTNAMLKVLSPQILTS